MQLKIDIPVLPALGSRGRIGRAAAMLDGTWTNDLATALREHGYEILSVPNFWTLPPALRERADVHSRFTAAVAGTLRRLGGVDFVISGNTDSLLLARDGSAWRSLGEIIDVPTVIWWFDDPRLELHLHVQSGMLRLFPLLDRLRSSAFHHVMIDRAMAETFSRDGFFARVTHLPVAACPRRFHPESVAAGEAVDLVMIGNGYSGRDARSYAAEHLGPGVHDTLLRPIAERKGLALDRTLDDLLAEREAEIDDPAAIAVARAWRTPWRADTALTAFHAWKANTFLWCELRNDAVRACRARLGERFRLFGRHWEPTGVRSEPFLRDTREQRRWYARARVGLTCNHGQLQTGVPFRLWELAASGTAIVAQACAELEDYFEPGRECEVFTRPEAAPEAVERLLRDDARRRRIAAAGHARFLHEHQWSRRVGSLLERIGRPLPAAASI